MGGLIGGESRKLSDLQSSGKNIAGNLISKAIAYSMGVLEVNASMGAHRCRTDSRLIRCYSRCPSGTSGRI